MQKEELAAEIFSDTLLKYEFMKFKWANSRPIGSHQFSHIHFLNHPLERPMGDEQFIDRHVKTEDFPRDLSFAFLGGEYGTTIHSVTPVKVFDRRLRGRIKQNRIFSSVYEHIMIATSPSNQKNIGTVFYHGISGTELLPCRTSDSAEDRSYGQNQESLAQLSHSVLSPMVSLWHYKRYMWLARFHLENIGLCLHIDPSTARYFFKNREVSQGKTRKSAIRNFVMEHNRYIQQKLDPVQVRRHLRGTVKFKWMGIDTEIIPAPYDLEIIEKGIYSRDNHLTDSTQIGLNT